MKLFHNTIGGTYAVNPDNQSVSYTFPDNANIHLNGVDISIGGLTVDCYGGKFTADEALFFSSVASCIPPQLPSIYNTNIVICDSDISGDGYPSQNDFKQYHMSYLSIAEFRVLQNEEVAGDYQHPKANELIDIIAFFDQWAEDNCTKIKDNIQQLLNKDNSFPKQLSLLYDDRQIEHMTHIILTYHAVNNCTLTINNTVSAAIAFGDNYAATVSERGVDLYTCKERISSRNPRFVELYKNHTDEKPDLELEFTTDINLLFLKNIYQRMSMMLVTKLDVPITKVKITQGYNEKNTEECVTYSIQNKLNFLQNNYELTHEPSLDLGIRLRAEHVILSRLLHGMENIPGFDNVLSLNPSCPQDSWYANYPVVCEQLTLRIKQLALADLQKLYLALQIDDCLALSPVFATILLDAIQDKMNEDSYMAVNPASLTAERAELLQTLMAPVVMYKKESHSLFFSKPYLDTKEIKNIINEIDNSLRF